MFEWCNLLACLHNHERLLIMHFRRHLHKFAQLADAFTYLKFNVKIRVYNKRIHHKDIRSAVMDVWMDGWKTSNRHLAIQQNVQYTTYLYFMHNMTRVGLHYGSISQMC